MLQLKNITKNYYLADLTVPALKGVSINFRESEFVSVLGTSGCGKTTLLNIIGGLDRYTEGDLIINGVSTKDYKDSDWDAYRNHSIGFVFQSYNLISHQNVLANVELALTLSGIKGDEKHKRAVQALEKVGLGDQLTKKPNQLSGGQMQRVAIARAIVNNPDIILADEPTGALDTATSIQIMNILKEISREKLVIMVTHNPSIAEEYSTRIISLSDGLKINDSAPYLDEDAEEFAKVKLVKADNADNEVAAVEQKDAPTTNDNQETTATVKPKKKKRKKIKTSMGFFTALRLSINNLRTKFARTFLTAFAGSFGIIGIALILSLSNGFNGYVQDIQRDTLTNYPITIEKENFDYSSALSAFMGTEKRDGEKYPTNGIITSQNSIDEMLNQMVSGYSTNDLATFKQYLDKNIDTSMISAVQYTYDLKLSIYTQIAANNDGLRAVSPVVLPPIGELELPDALKSLFAGYYKTFEGFMNKNNVFTEMIDNQALIKQQYDVLKGRMPDSTNKNEVLLVVDEYNQLSDMTLYMLGLMSDKDIMFIFTKLGFKMQDNAAAMLAETSGEAFTAKTDAELTALTEKELGYKRSRMEYTLDELLKLEYYAVLPGQMYEKDHLYTDTAEDGGALLGQPLQTYKLKSDDSINKTVLSSESEKLRVTGIARLKNGVQTGALSGAICYNNELTDALISKNLQLDIVRDHLAEAEKGKLRSESSPHLFTYNVLNGKRCDLPNTSSANTYAKITTKLGISYENDPKSIAIYPNSFDNKDYIISFIDDYNNTHEKTETIKYTDYIGSLMSSITTIINAVSYVLIAFVSISLVVSSIMIGVITYISVLERTKEIGILRSIGASKRDIRRVFNAETGIIGLVAGLLGVGIALLLTIPINIIILSLSGLSGVASLPFIGGVALVLISVTLTLISGLIPANVASKKDPVVALRTE